MYIDYSTKKEILKDMIKEIKGEFVATYELCKKYPELIEHHIAVFDGYLDGMEDASYIIDYSVHDECHIYRKSIRRALKYDLVWVANADLYR